MAVFPLPSQGVPVLLGMKELSYLNAFLGCATGRCLVGGSKVILRKTAKGHLVMDFVEHIFPKGSKAVETTSTKVFQEQPQKPKPVKKVWKWVLRTRVTKKSVTFGSKQMYRYLLEFDEGNPSECCLSAEQIAASVVSPECEPAEHLMINLDELEFCGLALHLPR